MTESQKAIALEARLKPCKNVLTLGLRTNFADYRPEEVQLIRQAPKIYYPTTFYADLFGAMGKATFPTFNTYHFAQDKIKQTALFQVLGIPHPRTRIFYGKRQQQMVTDYFQFPFIAKIPRGSALGRGVYLIRDQEELNAYLQLTHTAYIQEYLPSPKDIRVVIVGDQIIHAYWRAAQAGEFRNNVSLGGDISIASVPREALDLALYTTKQCHWNDVGIDILPYKHHFYVLEANMKYGKQGFAKAGMDYYRIMEQLIAQGWI